MKIPKDNGMLIDIQYLRPDRRIGRNKDYLYIIWKDLRTNEKHLETIEEPLMTIYFEKPEFRNHVYNKTYARLEELEPRVVKVTGINDAIVDDWGPEGHKFRQKCYDTRDYNALRELNIYPYVFGADYDPRVWYRYKWLTSVDTDKPKHISKGFLDIEVDILESVGMPDPRFNPIDLVTLIDVDSKTSYTFALLGVGKDREDKDITNMDKAGVYLEYQKRRLYERRNERHEYYKNNPDEIIEEAHKLFDENYPDMEYKLYFYEDEAMMLVHLFQLINQLKLDFIGIWNISFDIPYIIERLKALNLNPEDVMCHPDFKEKECYFKKDTINFAVKNKSDFFHCSSYTIFYDQMITYAAIRKGQQELRSNRLTYIAKKEIGDEKLDYSEVGNIKTLSYGDYLKYVLYNIKDVLLQVGIEEVTADLETYYITSYKNITPYESEFKQTVKLRNVQYKSFLSQGIVPGANVNGFLYNYREEKEDDDEDEEEESSSGSKKDVGFEGALVGNPTLIDNFGVELFGKKTNSIFNYSVDFDMSAFYPSTIQIMNIDPTTLIFKMILDSSQYDVRGGDIPFNGITDVQIVKTNSDSFSGDISKEVMDNFQTRNYLFTANKWMNMPSVNDVYEEIKRRLK